MSIDSIVKKASGAHSNSYSNKAPTNDRDYYDQLVNRNQHFISHETQTKLRSLKVTVGGCGTVGGACIEPLARLGVKNFKLADNGSYELTNLNRQGAYLTNLGENKATYNLKRLKQVNPFIKAEAYPEGVTPDNVQKLVDWADLVVDAVDITSKESIRMKIALHESAKLAKKPVFSAMDPGFCNCGLGYDYRNKNTKVLDGRLSAAKSADHPFKAWFYILPVSLIPTHCLPLIIELLQGKTTTGSQLGVSANLLAAIMASCVVRFVEKGVLTKKWIVNLEYLAISFRMRLYYKFQRPFFLYKINRLLSALP